MQRDATKCNATRRDGSPCRSPVVLPSGFCPLHDPDRQAAVRSAGGRAKSQARRLDRLVPATLKPVLAALLGALEEVHDGQLAPVRAQAMASLASAAVKVYQVGALEERLATLEEELHRERDAQSA